MIFEKVYYKIQTNLTRYQLLQLHTSIMHFDPFPKVSALAALVIPWLFSCTSRKLPSKSSSGIKAILSFLSFCKNFHKTSGSIFVVHFNTMTT
jgi:hypothetical protein